MMLTKIFHWLLWFSRTTTTGSFVRRFWAHVFNAEINVAIRGFTSLLIGDAHKRIREERPSFMSTGSRKSSSIFLLLDRLISARLWPWARPSFAFVRGSLTICNSNRKFQFFSCFEANTFDAFSPAVVHAFLLICCSSAFLPRHWFFISEVAKDFPSQQRLLFYFFFSLLFFFCSCSLSLRVRKSGCPPHSFLSVLLVAVKWETWRAACSVFLFFMFTC